MLPLFLPEKREICDVEKLIDTSLVIKRPRTGEHLILLGVGLSLYVVDLEGAVLFTKRMLSSEENGYLQEIQYFQSAEKVVFVPKQRIFSMSMKVESEFEVSEHEIVDMKSRGDYYDLTASFFNDFIFNTMGTENNCLHHLDVETNDIVPHRRINPKYFEITCLSAVEEKGLIFLGGRSGLMVLDRHYEEIVVHDRKKVEVCSISYNTTNDRIVFGCCDGSMSILCDYLKKQDLDKLVQVKAFSHHEVHTVLSDGDLVIGANYLDPFVLVFHVDQFQVNKVEEEKKEGEKKEDEFLTKSKDMIDPRERFEKHKQYVNGMRWLDRNRRKYFISVGYNGKVNMYENLLFQELFVHKDVKERIEFLEQAMDSDDHGVGKSVIRINLIQLKLCAFKFLYY